MKIAIIRQRYNPFGGAERFVERALGALVEQGAEVTLITRSWDGAPREGFKQIICDPAYSRLLGGRAARDRSFAASASLAMRQGGFDITQSHERIPGCMIFRAGDGVHAAWLEYRARILNPWQRMLQDFSSYHRYVLSVEKAMFQHPDLRAVICNSHMVADEIVHYFAVDRSKLHVVYNGYDKAVFHPELANEFRESTRSNAGIPNEVPLLLYVGSGYERKGVPQLLRAFARMPRSDAHLLIVGADRKLQEMKAMANSLKIGVRTHFVGAIKDVRPFYGAADGFVLPTLYDPCPNAALEAMACGLPIVTSTNCGAREWVVQGENGWVIDALDVEGITTALGRLCTWAGSARHRQYSCDAVAELTLDNMTSRLLAIYGSLRAGSGGV